MPAGPPACPTGAGGGSPTSMPVSSSARSSTGSTTSMTRWKWPNSSKEIIPNSWVQAITARTTTSSGTVGITWSPRRRTCSAASGSRTGGLRRPPGSISTPARDAPSTMPASTRVTLVLAGIVDGASRAGVLIEPGGLRRPPVLDPDAAEQVRRLGDQVMPTVPDEVVVRAVIAWTQLFGMISFELFGHFHRVIDVVEPVLEQCPLEHRLD